MMLIQPVLSRLQRNSCRVLFLAGISVLPLLGFSTSFAQQEAPMSVPASDRLERERYRDRTHGETGDADNYNVNLVGRWIGGMCYAVAVRDSIAYAGVVGGLIVVDFTSLDSPVELAQCPLPGIVEAIHLSGQHAYVANGTAGLRIVDISNPASPREIGSFDTDDFAYDVAISGGFAYVADYRGGLRVIDVSNPATPFEIGYYDTDRFARGVAVSGNYAYVADDNDGLRVIDVSNPADPFETGFYDTGGNAYDVAVSGNYAYVADDGDGLRVIDVSNPADPQEVGFYDPGIYATNLVVSGNYVYVGSGVRFRVIDISDPTNPLEVASRLSWGDGVNGIALEGDLAYVANSRRVRVRDISVPEDPDPVGQYETGDAVYGVAVGGDYAYIAESSYGLRVVDISNPMVPIAIGRFDAPGSGHDVAVRGRYAYLAAETGGLRVIDISDPTDPQEVAFSDPDGGGSVYDVLLSGDYAYVTAQGLRVVNISDPMTPFEESSSEPMSATGIAVSGDYAYLVGLVSGLGTGWLRVINITDPADPAEESVYTTGRELWGVDVRGIYAYIAAGYNGLRVINISDPASPVEEAYYDPGNLFANDVTVSGNYAYVAYDDGLRVIDVSDPLAPVEAGFYGTYLAWRAAVRGDHVYVADHWNGFYILEYIVPKVTGAHLDIKPGSCPNPLNITAPKGEKANGGVLPVAVLGSDEFDVHDIDVSSLELEGASPLRYSYKDVAGPAGGDDDCACSEVGPDGYTDLTLKFTRLEVVAGLGSVSGDGVPVTLTGRAKDGTPIELSDCVKIVPRKGEGGPQLTPSGATAVTALGRATPNPFNPTTIIGYQLAERGRVTLKVYDVRGKIVATLVEGELPGGRHEVTWEASGIPSGLYFYRLTTGSFSETRKMVLLK